MPLTEFIDKLGLKVTLLQRADRLMNQQLDEAGAAKLQGYLESIGLQVLTRTSVTKYEGQPQLQLQWREFAAMADLASRLDVRGRRLVVVALINHDNAGAARGALDLLVDWVAQEP